MGVNWGKPLLSDVGSAALPTYSYRELPSTGSYALKAGWGGISSRKAMAAVAVGGAFQMGVNADGQAFFGGYVDIAANYKAVSYGDIMAFTGCMTTYNDASSGAGTRGFAISLNGTEYGRYTTTNTDIQITGPGGVVLKTINHITKTDKSYGPLDGMGSDYIKAQDVMSGGGLITWGGSGGNYKWTTRFIVIPLPRGTISTAGYIDINCQDFNIPAANTHNNTARQMTAAGGIVLNSWEALWAIHTPGGDNVSITFAITIYTVGFIAPSNWLMIGVVNGDNGSILTGTGICIPAACYWSVDTGVVSRFSAPVISDQNLSTNMRALNATELAAWAFVTPFIYNQGGGARLSASVLGQYIEYYFSTQGLNAANYSLIEKFNINGFVYYSVRMDECFAWEMAYQRSRQQGRVQREPLTVTAANTLSPMSKVYLGEFAEIIVNGVEYASYSNKKPFTITTGGNTVTWDATKAGYALKTTDDVVIRYSY